MDTVKTQITVTKTYSNLKAAHRQWRHPGHCRFIHGENWTFHITFIASELDDKNFVVDFGGLKGIRERLDQQFDHVTLIDEDDPEKDFFIKELHGRGLTDLRVVPSASAEGLAKLVFEIANQYVIDLTEGRVNVLRVIAEEDEKNTATYQEEPLKKEKASPISGQ